MHLCHHLILRGGARLLPLQMVHWKEQSPVYGPHLLLSALCWACAMYRHAAWQAAFPWELPIWREGWQPSRGLLKYRLQRLAELMHHQVYRLPGLLAPRGGPCSLTSLGQGEACLWVSLFRWPEMQPTDMSPSSTRCRQSVAASLPSAHWQRNLRKVP